MVIHWLYRLEREKRKNGANSLSFHSIAGQEAELCVIKANTAGPPQRTRRQVLHRGCCFLFFSRQLSSVASVLHDQTLRSFMMSRKADEMVTPRVLIAPLEAWGGKEKEKGKLFIALCKLTIQG